MADLLKRLQKQNVAVDYVGKLLAAFGHDADRSLPEVSDAPTAPESPVYPQEERPASPR